MYTLAYPTYISQNATIWIYLSYYSYPQVFLHNAYKYIPLLSQLKHVETNHVYHVRLWKQDNLKSVPFLSDSVC